MNGEGSATSQGLQQNWDQKRPTLMRCGQLQMLHKKLQTVETKKGKENL